MITTLAVRSQHKFSTLIKSADEACCEILWWNLHTLYWFCQFANLANSLWVPATAEFARLLDDGVIRPKHVGDERINVVVICSSFVCSFYIYICLYTG